MFGVAWAVAASENASPGHASSLCARGKLGHVDEFPGSPIVIASVCCPANCERCGGVDCWAQAGGRQCCGKQLHASGVMCMSSGQTACILPTIVAQPKAPAAKPRQCFDLWAAVYPQEKLDWKGRSCKFKTEFGQCDSFYEECQCSCGYCESAHGCDLRAPTSTPVLGPASGGDGTHPGRSSGPPSAVATERTPAPTSTTSPPPPPPRRTSRPRPSPPPPPAVSPPSPLPPGLTDVIQRPPPPAPSPPPQEVETETVWKTVGEEPGPPPPPVALPTVVVVPSRAGAGEGLDTGNGGDGRGSGGGGDGGAVSAPARPLSTLAHSLSSSVTGVGESAAEGLLSVLLIGLASVALLLATLALCTRAGRWPLNPIPLPPDLDDI